MTVIGGGDGKDCVLKIGFDFDLERWMKTQSDKTFENQISLHCLGLRLSGTVQCIY